MKFATTLILSRTEELEKRLTIILEYLNSLKKDAECTLSGMDATGELGNKMTHRLNEEKEVQIKLIDLINIAKENGQIFDFDAIVYLNNNYWIKVSRGEHVDIIGEEKLPLAILGNHEDLDIEHFI